MIACCNNCSNFYINRDGTIDLERYIEIARKTESIPKTFRIVDDKIEVFVDRVCMCECHQDGKLILH